MSVIAAFYRAYLRGDRDRYVGRAAVVELWRRLAEDWENFRLAPGEITGAGPRRGAWHH